MYYTDVRDHTSPSALALWLSSPRQFEQVYFAGKKQFTTPQMQNGKDKHKDIELGVLGAKLAFENKEMRLEVDVKKGVPMVFICDSHDSDGVRFVDYKTGKPWSKAEVESDNKQAFTALGLALYYKVDEVFGSIEHINEDDETGKSNTVHTVVYTADRLKEIKKLASDTIKQINKAYEEWLERTDVFVDDEDLRTYAELVLEKKSIEAQIAEVGKRLFEAMDAGGLKSNKTPYGTFTITERKVYEVPTKLAQAESKAKEAVKAWKKTAEPSDIIKGLTFRGV